MESIRRTYVPGTAWMYLLIQQYALFPVPRRLYVSSGTRYMPKVGLGQLLSKLWCTSQSKPNAHALTRAVRTQWGFHSISVLVDLATNFNRHKRNISRDANHGWKWQWCRQEGGGKDEWKFHRKSASTQG
jgi:hypothetical protein